MIRRQLDRHSDDSVVDQDHAAPPGLDIAGQLFIPGRGRDQGSSGMAIFMGEPEQGATGDIRQPS